MTARELCQQVMQQMMIAQRVMAQGIAYFAGSGKQWSQTLFKT